MTQSIEDEYHFIIDCSYYSIIRSKFYEKIHKICPNFENLDSKSKLHYLLSAEDRFINLTAQYLKEASQMRECHL